jgi:hypothetical protein
MSAGSAGGGARWRRHPLDRRHQAPGVGPEALMPDQQRIPAGQASQALGQFVPGRHDRALDQDGDDPDIAGQSGLDFQPDNATALRCGHVQLRYRRRVRAGTTRDRRPRSRTLSTVAGPSRAVLVKAWSSRHHRPRTSRDGRDGRRTIHNPEALRFSRRRPVGAGGCRLWQGGDKVRHYQRTGGDEGFITPPCAAPRPLGAPAERAS